MTATESKCPHCNGSLERWEDPKAVLIITTLTAENERLREALENIRLEYASNIRIRVIDSNIAYYVSKALNQAEQEENYPFLKNMTIERRLEIEREGWDEQTEGGYMR